MHTTRRQAILTLAAAPIAAPAAAKTSRVTDPHPGWLSEMNRIFAAWTATVENSAEDKALGDELTRLEDRFAATPARTFEGFAAQLEWLVEDGADDQLCEVHGKLMRTLRASFGDLPHA